MFDFEQQIVMWTLKGYVTKHTLDVGWTEKHEIKLAKDQFTACIYYDTPFTAISGIMEEALDGHQHLGTPGVSLDKLLEVFS